jgi:hypothetical protein
MAAPPNKHKKTEQTKARQIRMSAPTFKLRKHIVSARIITALFGSHPHIRVLRYAAGIMSVPVIPSQETEQVRPSLWYAAIAAPFLLAGLLWSGFLFYRGIVGIANAMVRTEIPNPVEAALHKNLKYTVFLELVSDSASNPSPQLQASVDCQVSSLPWGTPVTLTPPTVHFTYALPSVSGRSVYEFVPPNDGTYLVGCSNLRGWKGPARTAVGTGAAEALGRLIVRCLLTGGFGVVIALLIFIRVIMLRDQSRREIRSRGLRPA